MSTDPSFRMVVADLVDARPRGMIVMGRVEGGEINKGDAVQIGAAPDAKTTKVGQILLGKEFYQPTPSQSEVTVQQMMDSIKQAKRRVLKALPRSDVTLLLLGLSPADIRIGDVLLPGRKEQMPHTPEAEHSMRMPERITPLLQTGAMLGPIVTLAAAIIFLFLAAYSLFGVLFQGREVSGVKPVVFLLMMLGTFGLMTYIAIRTVKNIRIGLKARREFRVGSATTTARILRRFEVAHQGSYGTTYTYHLHVEFNPTLAQKPTGLQRYSLSTNKKLYDQLEHQDSVILTYATGNPQVFVIEGE